ncbi:MAG: cell envelope biogenesis protein OmpA, partial [Candidatus Dadabacteria bacterium]
MEVEMMRNTLLGIACLGWLAVNGCTVPGDTTKLGAATGGIIGAGVGALVGSQTATPAGGLIVGGLAGSAAGAAVGNALEAHEEQLRRQDEA